MLRTALRLFVAVALVGMGWFAGHVQAPQRGIFRLNVEAPAGVTTLRCEGCQFFSYPNGRAQMARVFTHTCSGGADCWTVVGATLAVDVIASR